MGWKRTQQRGVSWGSSTRGRRSALKKSHFMADEGVLAGGRGLAGAEGRGLGSSPCSPSTRASSQNGD